MTNAEKIRDMTDDDLAKWIAKEGGDCKGDPDYLETCSVKKCVMCWLGWLESKADGDEVAK